MDVKFNVSGMTCAACSARVEKVTKQIQGVKRAEVNLLAGSMNVELEDESVVQSVIDAVNAAGYSTSVPGTEASAENFERSHLGQMRSRIIWSGVFLGILMYFTMGHMLGLPLPSWYHGAENAAIAALLQFVLTLPVVYLNRVYYIKGLKALYNRAPNMDSLIAVGSGAALIYGIAAVFRIAYSMGHGDLNTAIKYSENLYFESAAMILTLITVGKFLETRAKGKTGDAVRQLMDLNPKTATVMRDDAEVIVPIDNVKIGDVVVVRSGGSIPVDGCVLTGRAAVDQSALTGESIPVEKNVGDWVASATINTEGYLEIRAEKIGQDTALAQVIRLVEQAGGSKAPIARLADKVAGVFVPVVMAIATVTFIVWMLASQTLEFSLTSAISVLVISCPCALGLATPVAIMVGTGRGAKMGILFKNALSLENLHKVDTVVLDKTGTLTLGKPAVTDVLPAAVTEERLLSVAASLEVRSEHPFAKAIMAKADNIPYSEPESFETLPGSGVSAVIDNVQFYGGNAKLMAEHGILVPEYPELTTQRKTILYFASENKEYLGAIAVADVLKQDSVAAIQMLHKMRLRVVMLTGDNEATARAVAETAGITEIISDVRPADKADVIEKLRVEGHNVLMVGDGINDAPALVTADVGMAIGAGTDIAIEAADIVLMNHSLMGVCNAIALSRATIRNIRQNLFWAFFYNCLGIPIAAGALYPAFHIQLSPMLGAAAMSMSSVFVVTNALRLRFYKFKLGGYHDQLQNDKFKKEINMETVICVEGMMCTHCKARVETVCKAVPGVVDAVVDLAAKQVTVTGTASREVLKKAITDAGYEVVE